jgi:hypothetical protein
MWSAHDVVVVVVWTVAAAPTVADADVAAGLFLSPALKEEKSPDAPPPPPPADGSFLLACFARADQAF